jgi:hypothetical protein
MKCYRHTEVDAAGYCRQCGKALCPECRRDVRGMIYCEDCLAAAAAGAGPGKPSPGLALGLGFIPGVGAIYNGEYVKGFIHIIIFGFLVSIIDSNAARGLEPMVGLLLAGFVFYMVFDAYQTARRRAAGEPAGPQPWEQLGFTPGGQPTPIGPLILIVLGALFLFNNLGFFYWMSYMRKLWPLVLIVIGVLLLMRRTGALPPKSQGGQ